MLQCAAMCLPAALEELHGFSAIGAVVVAALTAGLTFFCTFHFEPFIRCEFLNSPNVVPTSEEVSQSAELL
jgi:hypothetical protein